MKKIKTSVPDRIFSAMNVVVLAVLSLLCIVPFLHILAVSVSSRASTTAGTVGLFPVGFNLNSYREAFKTNALLQAFWVTIERMVLGTVISMVLTILVAYPLSFNSSQFWGRKFYVGFFFFSMIFSGGIIPYYVLMKDLGLMDSIWVLVLGPVPVGSVIILLNFFRQLPKALYESTVIDGASHFTIMTKIYFPLSLPSVATLSLMSLVGHWNEWFGGMIYMKSPSKYPLQTYLYMAMQKLSEFSNLEQGEAASMASRQGLLAAQIVISILPILVVYPLLQKYVKTGLVLGSVKE